MRMVLGESLGICQARTTALLSSLEISSKPAEGGEWPMALTDTESVLYGRDRSRSKPEDLEPLVTNDATEPLLLWTD